jgi:organic radical activating enzyme
MRFPLPLTAKIARFIIGKKLRGVEKFATVLQLEPLHTCNLTCTGCGRIREYSTSLKDVMRLEDCLGAAQECGAPMISICGGEPLIYPQIEELVGGLLGQKRIVYICTNGMFMRKKMRDYMAQEFAKVHASGRTESELDTKLNTLLRGLSPARAEEIRKPKAKAARPVISRGGCIGCPSGRFGAHA